MPKKLKKSLAVSNDALANAESTVLNTVQDSTFTFYNNGNSLPSSGSLSAMFTKKVTCFNYIITPMNSNSFGKANITFHADQQCKRTVTLNADGEFHIFNISAMWFKGYLTGMLTVSYEAWTPLEEISITFA